MSEEAPTNAKFKVWFVRCAGCKNPFASMEYQNSSAVTGKLEKRIDNLEASIANIDYMVRQILQK
jgi:hypothetical protein